MIGIMVLITEIAGEKHDWDTHTWQLCEVTALLIALTLVTESQYSQFSSVASGSCLTL